MYNQLQLKEYVERAITNLSLGNEAENLTDPVRYVLSIGGKRLRPILTLMACNLFSDQIDEAVIPSAGIEVFHNFTLVHDDIMDQAPLRRNFPTVHTKWNLNQAVLSGDVMAFIANDCFLQTPARCMPGVFRVFNRAAIDVCTGQQLDMDFEKAVKVSQGEYIKMTGLKTAALIAASVKIGAIIGNAGEKDCGLMHDFGWNLGLAFQIQDDLLDIYGDVMVFGKMRGGDIIAGKKTLLYVKAMELASGKQLNMLRKLFAETDPEPENKIRRVTEIYDQIGVRNAAENIAGGYITEAFSCLERINMPAERKKEIAELAGTLIGREK